MSNKDYAHITLVMDRSGSMSSIKSDAIGGFNSLVESQKLQPGFCTMTFVQFDHEYDEVYSFVPLSQVLPRDEKNFVPRGNTALLDAIGRAIVSTGEKLSAMSEDQRPGVVILAILTDGHENASKEYRIDQIREKIKHQIEVYKWQVTFLGASLDAIEVAGNLGIDQRMAARFVADGPQVHETYKASGNVISRSRRAAALGEEISASLGFQESERKLMVETPSTKTTPDPK